MAWGGEYRTRIGRTPSRGVHASAAFLNHSVWRRAMEIPAGGYLIVYGIAALVLITDNL